MQNGPVSTERPNISSSISAVILDYGQVLARSATREDFERMAKMFHLSFEVFYPLWEASRDIYDRGDLTPEEYWLKLAVQANTSVDRSQIEILRNVEIEIWAHVDQDMLDWVSQLRAAGVKTGLLSNMPCDLVTYLRANCEWMENFSFKTFSSEVRLIKPDPAIYAHTLHGLGVSASEALFVDDREVNIEAARALGIRAIQFQSMAQLRHDLEALGFPILPAGAETSAAVSGAVSPAERPGREIKFQL
jgi:putative hydrolase of the HAD superfamily